MLADLRELYVEEERRLAELRARYQDDHPLVQQQNSKVTLVLRELKREAEVAQTAADVRYDETVRDEQKVLAQLEQVKQEGLRLTRLEIEYNKLKRDADSLQKQYTMVLNRTKETGMVGRLKLNNVRGAGLRAPAAGAGQPEAAGGPDDGGAAVGAAAGWCWRSPWTRWTGRSSRRMTSRTSCCCRSWACCRASPRRTVPARRRRRAPRTCTWRSTRARRCRRRAGRSAPTCCSPGPSGR